MEPFFFSDFEDDEKEDEKAKCKDEDPPLCSECNGRGKILLFMSDDDCEACGGSGY